MTTTPSLKSMIYDRSNKNQFVTGEHAERMWSNRNLHSDGTPFMRADMYYANRNTNNMFDNGGTVDLTGFVGNDPTYHIQLGTNLRQVHNLDSLQMRTYVHPSLRPENNSYTNTPTNRLAPGQRPY